MTYQALAGLLKERVILVTGASRGSARGGAHVRAVRRNRDPAWTRSGTPGSGVRRIEAAGGPRRSSCRDLAMAAERDYDNLAQGIESQLGASTASCTALHT